MTVFERIINAIAPFNYPYAPDVYNGSEERYFVYNYADERGALFANDDAIEIIVSVQVHFYLPARENFIAVKNKIKKALHHAGFTYPQVTVLKEDKKRHIIFECDIDELEE